MSEKRGPRGGENYHGGNNNDRGGKIRINRAENKSSSGDRRPYPGGNARGGAGTKHSGGRTGANFANRSREGGNERREASRSDGMPARRVALQVIREVTEKGRYASLSLNAHLTGSGLSLADRRFASRLAYDTIEKLIYLDAALDQVMAKPNTDIRLKNVLRLGACQILLEDRIPESAACNTSTELCREVDHGAISALAGVCNGILRNLARKRGELVWPDPEKEPLRARSLKYDVPEWLVERLDADWGREHADGILSCRNRESITVRRNQTRLTQQAFEEMLEKKAWQVLPSPVPDAARVAEAADIGMDRDFQSGLFSIQSESSMIACMAVAPQRGWTVLDACAAPGGKACLIAEMMGGTGRVQAWELHEGRTALITAQAARLGLENIRPITRDATVLREDLAQTMDAVLIDAPCSGLGNLSDKPELRHRVTPESVAGLAAVQARLLECCSSYVKRGGVLVYTTCSVLREENEDQIRAFLEKHKEFTPEPLPETIPEELRRFEGLGLQIFQDRDGMSGFYMVRLRRSRR